MNIIDAIKKLYPGIDGGFVYWYTKHDGTAWDNPEDGLIWTNTEYEKPSWEDIEAELGGVDLQEAKDKKEVELKENRKVFMYLPIEYNGSTFINSEKSGNNLQAAYTFYDEPIDWLDSSGNVVALSKTQIGDIVKLIMDHRGAAYFQQAIKSAQIQSCETISDVEDVDINFL
jgi:hypothetical protein